MQIEHLRERFESEFRSGKSPRLEVYLSEVPASQRDELTRVLQEVTAEASAGSEITRSHQDSSEESSELQPADIDHERTLVQDDVPSVASFPPGQTAPGQTAPGPSAPGTKIGRYTVGRVLGEGAFGTVWLARDEELRRDVAIKVPRRDRFESGAAEAEFLEEARTVAKLQHPGIVAVYDVGHTSDKTPFVVLEFINGPALADQMKTQPLPQRRAARLMAAVADAVAFAHRQGFVHRDLKPANILLDSQDVPHVSDFGLAVHESNQSGRKGEFAGTSAYMSPEQIRGEAHRLDGRADIWALGVILYRMLSGRLPFTGKTLIEVADEIQTRDPKPLRQIDDGIPLELEVIVGKCCQKLASARYSTATDLASDLRAWLGDETTRNLAANSDTFRVKPLPVANPTDLHKAIGLGLAAALLVCCGLVAMAFRPSTHFEPIVAGNSGAETTTSGGATSGSATPAGLSPPAAGPVTATAPSAVDARPLMAPAGLPANAVHLELIVQTAERKTGWQVLVPQNLPLHNDDKVQIHVTSTQPAYIYLYWFDGQGRPHRFWPRSLENQQPLRELYDPQVASDDSEQLWHLLGGEPGTELVIAAASATPLNEHDLHPFESVRVLWYGSTVAADKESGSQAVYVTKAARDEWKVLRPSPHPEIAIVNREPVATIVSTKGKEILPRRLEEVLRLFRSYEGLLVPRE